MTTRLPLAAAIVALGAAAAPCGHHGPSISVNNSGRNVTSGAQQIDVTFAAP